MTYTFGRKTGVLVFGNIKGRKVDATISSLRTHCEEHEVLTAQELNERYSEQLQLPADFKGVFEKDGGVLLANEAVEAYQVYNVA